MNLISYRGPGVGGGVSAAFSRLWEAGSSNAMWWHLDGEDLVVSLASGSERKTSRMSKTLLDKHYRYCNEFLWPILHDMPDLAIYRAEDHRAYTVFNEIVGSMIGNMQTNNNGPIFVQDYQFGTLPLVLAGFGVESGVFWHIPWPKEVREDHVSAMKQIARSFLHAETVGFHTREYADNFLRFVYRHLDEQALSHSRLLRPDFSERTGPHGLKLAKRSRVLVAPLGIDTEHWNHLAKKSRLSQAETPFDPNVRTVLSVERADYTKGVANRLRAIDAFFELYPQHRGKVSFFQQCGRTRPGLQAFDRYFDECKSLAQQIDDKWQSEGWHGLMWEEENRNSAQLAGMYGTADVMLVNPVRDGLNLTAKEYVACQSYNPGVLALSAGAGVWHELGSGCVEVEPQSPQQVAAAVNQALMMSYDERVARMDTLKSRVSKNTLAGWWNLFDTELETRAAGLRKAG